MALPLTASSCSIPGRGARQAEGLGVVAHPLVPPAPSLHKQPEAQKFQGNMWGEAGMQRKPADPASVLNNSLSVNFRIQSLRKGYTVSLLWMYKVLTLGEEVAGKWSDWGY